MRHVKVGRVMRLALDMQASRVGVSLDEMARRFRVSRRTAQRMKDAVVGLFPPAVRTTDEERHKRWRLPVATATGLVHFVADELADLEGAARLLRRDS